MLMGKVLISFVFVLFHSVALANCSVYKVKLQVLGSGGPELDDGRASSSYLIWVDEKATILVDAGPGSSVNFGKAGADFADLQAILLTHLHVDHSADLPAYIKGSFFTSRNRDLAILGPEKNALMPATSDYVDRLLSQQGAFQYLQEYSDQSLPSDYLIKPVNVPLRKSEVSTYKQFESLKLSAMKVEHGPVAAVAWRVDIGTCRLVFSGDMSGKTQGFGDFAKQADLLIMHNAIPENAGQIAKNLHMTPSEMGKFSQQAGAKKMVISHRMNRTNDTEQQTIKLIRRHYTGALLLAEDMDMFDLD